MSAAFPVLHKSAQIAMWPQLRPWVGSKRWIHAIKPSVHARLSGPRSKLAVTVMRLPLCLVAHKTCCACAGIVDHHTLMANLHSFYHKEVTCRGFFCGNWKWLVTPMSASGNPCYLGLNKMTEYTLKPVGGWAARCLWCQPLLAIAVAFRAAVAGGTLDSVACQQKQWGQGSTVCLAGADAG